MTYSLIAMLFCWLLALHQPTDALHIEGRTMGTTYHITYFDEHGRDYKVSVDSVLREVNHAINTYDPTAEVSLFNKSTRGILLSNSHLRSILYTSEKVYRESQGAFDPTVMPLVNAWGFGPGKSFHVTQAKIDSLKQFVGFQKIRITKDSLIKLDPRVQLDFGGIGQGYGADAITSFLKSKGVTNLLVELGGEGMAIGKNIQKNKAWTIGILDPNSTRDNQFFKAYAEVKDQSYTTAGSYFNYREIDGKKYSHTIDPVTGYPADLPLLSASVFAKDCTTADAWDTAFMVMGHTQAIKLLNQRKDLNAILMYSTLTGPIETFITAGIKNRITLER